MVATDEAFVWSIVLMIGVLLFVFLAGIVNGARNEPHKVLYIISSILFATLSLP